MNGGAARFVVFALLVFQLAIGLPLQTAQAGTLPGKASTVSGRTAAASGSPDMDSPSTAVAPGMSHSEHCSMGARAVNQRTDADSAVQGRFGEPSTSHVPSGQRHHHSGGHDCCQSIGCQCQCAYTPATSIPQVGVPASSAVIALSPAGAQVAVNRIDELFRPPIV